MKTLFFVAIDIGNTTITVGLFPPQDTQPTRVIRIPTHASLQQVRRCLRQLHAGAFEGVAIASVVPSLDRFFQNTCVELFGQPPLFITHKLKIGVKILIDTPAQMGADRIVNACAAHKLFGKKAIVIDFGTATTFDCVSARGEYLGGAICPGPKLSAKALAMHTAKLPLVAMAKPRRIIGKNTADCIRSGLFYGYIGLVREIVKDIQREMGGGAFVVATGGDATMISPYVPEIKRVEPALTLQGIKMIWEMNKENGGRR